MDTLGDVFIDDVKIDGLHETDKSMHRVDLEEELGHTRYSRNDMSAISASDIMKPVSLIFLKCF